MTARATDGGTDGRTEDVRKGSWKGAEDVRKGSWKGAGDVRKEDGMMKRFGWMRIEVGEWRRTAGEDATTIAEKGACPGFESAGASGRRTSTDC
jgi:hypothetical protein